MTESSNRYPHEELALTLRAEIGYFEQRLNEIGCGGDCAYEHALSKFYLTQIDEKRQHLGRL